MVLVQANPQLSYSREGREEWHLPVGGSWEVGRRGSNRWPVVSATYPLPSFPAAPLQNGRSSSSASSASGKSSNPSFPLAPAAPAATRGAEKVSAPSPLPDSRISSRPLISV